MLEINNGTIKFGGDGMGRKIALFLVSICFLVFILSVPTTEVQAYVNPTVIVSASLVASVSDCEDVCDIIHKDDEIDCIIEWAKRNKRCHQNFKDMPFHLKRCYEASDFELDMCLNDSDYEWEKCISGCPSEQS